MKNKENKIYLHSLEDGKTIVYKANKKVHRSGSGGAINLPKNLVNEKVYVEFKRVDINDGENKKKK
tara:strand:+ start:154 stop:351 length:198 start_codon:yes stop_codon:yes gene_type:complete